MTLLMLSNQLESNQLVGLPEDEFEDGQGLLEVRVLGLGQEWGLDGFPLHLPQVGLEVDVGHLREHVVVDVAGQLQVVLDSCKK